jgi:hypothetical protein
MFAIACFFATNNAHGLELFQNSQCSVFVRNVGVCILCCHGCHYYHWGTRASIASIALFDPMEPEPFAQCHDATTNVNRGPAVKSVPSSDCLEWFQLVLCQNTSIHQMRARCIVLLFELYFPFHRWYAEKQRYTTSACSLFWAQSTHSLND